MTDTLFLSFSWLAALHVSLVSCASPLSSSKLSLVSSRSAARFDMAKGESRRETGGRAETKGSGALALVAAIGE